LLPNSLWVALTEISVMSSAPTDYYFPIHIPASWRRLGAAACWCFFVKNRQPPTCYRSITYGKNSTSSVICRPFAEMLGDNKPISSKYFTILQCPVALKTKLKLFFVNYSSITTLRYATRLLSIYCVILLARNKTHASPKQSFYPSRRAWW